MRLHLPRLFARLAVTVCGVFVLLTCDGAKSTELSVGPPASIMVVGGQEQTGIVAQALPEPVQVRIVDSRQRPVASQPVHFVVTSGNGTVSPEQTATSGDGLASAQWTLGSSSSEKQTLEARANDAKSGATLLTVAFRATPTSASASELTRSAGDEQTVIAGTAVPVAPSVKAVDAWGNVVQAESVTWRITSGDGSLSAGVDPTSSTNESGIAVLPGTWTLGPRVGGNTLTATISNGRFATFSASGHTGPPSQLAFVVPPSTVATNGEHLPRLPVLQLQDQSGNPVRVANVVVQITHIPGSGAGTLQILNDTTRTDAEGVATFTGTTLNGHVGEGYRLGFSTPTTSTLTSEPISLLRGQPYALALRIPADGATRGSAFIVQPVLQAVDAGGNPTAVGQCVNASISPGANLIGSTQTTTVTDTFEFHTLGVSASSSPGIFTITYTTGCCTPDQVLRSTSQTIQVQ